MLYEIQEFKQDFKEASWYGKIGIALSLPFRVLFLSLPIILVILFILGLFSIGPCQTGKLTPEEKQQQDWGDYWDYKHGPRG